MDPLLTPATRTPPRDFMSCRHGGGAGLGDRTRLQATSAASTKGPQLGSFSLSLGQSWDNKKRRQVVSLTPQLSCEKISTSREPSLCFVRTRSC